MSLAKVLCMDMTGWPSMCRSGGCRAEDVAGTWETDRSNSSALLREVLNLAQSRRSNHASSGLPAAESTQNHQRLHCC